MISNDGGLKQAEDAGIEPAGRHTAWCINDAEAFRIRMGAPGMHFDEISNLIGKELLFVLHTLSHTWEFQERLSPGKGNTAGSSVIDD